ncbi:MAG: hypothetical protein AB7F96_04805 [Beijerinckiaceae bacterium]
MTDKTMEDVYAALAEGIDAAGREKETMFLAKVSLLLAQELGDAGRALQLIAAAQANMEGVRTSA